MALNQMLGMGFSLLVFVSLALPAGVAHGGEREEKQALTMFIGEVDAIIELAKTSAKDVDGFEVNKFIMEMGAIRRSLETFINTGHADQLELGNIHGEYGNRLGKRHVINALYEKVLLLEEHVLEAKSRTEPNRFVDYDILVVELDIVEVGLEGVMRGG